MKPLNGDKATATAFNQPVQAIANTSYKWVLHFTQNRTKEHINRSIAPTVTATEKKAVLRSLQAWQSFKSADGRRLLCAAARYARAIGQPTYTGAVALYINEEQQHGIHLGEYLDAIGEKHIQQNRVESLLNVTRHIPLSMEWWVLAEITVKSSAQVYYQSLIDATGCRLLRQICTGILTDEALHLHFHLERMNIIYESKSGCANRLRKLGYKLFYVSTILFIWMGHRKVFKAGGNRFKEYMRKMKVNYVNTLGSIGERPAIKASVHLSGKGFGSLAAYVSSVAN